MYERAVFLSQLGFSILLMAGGIETIQCFPLPKAKDVDEKQMIEAVYGLVKEGFLQIEESGAVLTPELSEMIQSIKNAQTYLYMEPGADDQPQRIVYLGDRAVILENTTDVLRLFSKGQKEFWKWIEEAFDVPAVNGVSHQAAIESIQLSGAAIKEWENLKICSYLGFISGIGAWIEKAKNDFGDMPYVGIRFMGIYDEMVYRDILLLPGCMNTWFLWCDPQNDRLSGKGDCLEVVPDSIEVRDEILKLFWRESK